MKRKWSNANLSKRARRIVATATAFTFLCQNFAWAVCADGSTFPAGGFVFPPTADGHLVAGRLHGLRGLGLRS